LVTTVSLAAAKLDHSHQRFVMSHVFPVSLRAHSGTLRLALACSAAALITVSAAFPASAATIVNTSGQVGGVGLVDTSASPGATCKFTQPFVSLNQQPALSNIVLSGPTVGPIVATAGDSALTPALVSVDFRVYQQLTVNGDPAGSRLVLSAVHQVLATSISGTKVPDHTFDAHNLTSGRYTAQIVVTYKSTDQSMTYGSRTLRYDFYKSTLSAYSPAAGGFVERVTGVGSAC
jgi:hypothetical protein